LFEFSHALTA